MSKAMLACAAVLPAAWLVSGLYLSGSLTLLLLNQHAGDLHLLTYLAYVRDLDAPWLLADASRIRLAGALGFSLPALLAAGVVTALHRWYRKRAAITPLPARSSAPSLDTWLQREIEQINARTSAEHDQPAPAAPTARTPAPFNSPAEDAAVNLHALTRPALAASLVVSGCASLPANTADPDAPPLTVEQANARAPFLPPLPPVVVSGELADEGDPLIAAEMNEQRPKWPLRFKGTFGFGARCINTLSCSIPFFNMDLGNKGPVYATEQTYSQPRLDAFGGGYITRGFPEPVRISWRSLDGKERHAEIDLDAIFADRRLLHVVPRDEVVDMPDGTYGLMPHLLIEVNNRSIHVYMRAFVPTRHLQIPGNRYSSSRDDLILARSFHY